MGRDNGDMGSMTLQEVKDAISELAGQAHEDLMRNMAKILTKTGFINATELVISFGPLVCGWTVDEFKFEYTLKLDSV